MDEAQLGQDTRDLAHVAHILAKKAHDHEMAIARRNKAVLAQLERRTGSRRR
jgi:hypothetical protein